MTPPLLHRGFVHEQLQKLHDHLESIEGIGAITRAGRQLTPDLLMFIRHALADVVAHEPAPDVAGDYYSRSPLVSVVQSALHEHLESKRDRLRTGDSLTGHERGQAETIEHDDESMEDPFTKADIGGWVGEIALSLIWSWVHGTHPFCDQPARAFLPAEARLVLFADWGTGREHARDVGRHAQGWAYDSAVPAHVIHLGDNYYSGTPREARANILQPWPVGPGSAAQFGSWALNGNHDMYSGGRGLFETTLGDPRFHRQRVDGRPTSWFVLQTPDWNIVGLDTSWKRPLIEINGGAPYFEGSLGHLEGSQADVLAQCAKDLKRRMLVLSHHQLFSAYDHRSVFGGTSDTTPLEDKLAPLLARRPIDVWFWGHEHDCLAYGPFQGVQAARAIGHGGVPVAPREDPPAEPIGDDEFVVRPTLGADATDVQRALVWEYRGYRIGRDENRWAKHGFAVVDVAGRHLNVSYVDDSGHIWLTETL
jgi:Calcineurin-like phosphoesterase